MRIGSAFALSAALTLCACGGSGGGGGGGTCNPGATAAFTIKSTGITPAAVCVLPGPLPNGVVSFNNADTVVHTVTSTDCSAELNGLGSIAPSGTATANFGAAQKTCTFSVNPGNTPFQGTIGVTSAPAQGPGY